MDLEAYLDVRDRVGELVGADVGAIAVPACPGWCVRDVLAHLAGLCEDWVEGRLDGYASDKWTAAQIARFGGCTTDDILRRWVAASAGFAQLPEDPVMGPPARWAFGDAVTHEADIRGALLADRVPHAVVLTALKGSIARWRQTLRDAATPTLLIQGTDARDWWLGQPDDLAAVVVETSAYELFRALAGRRSERQISAWRWTGSPGAFVAAGPPYPFKWAHRDILNE
jgi:hypothetical protein